MRKVAPAQPGSWFLNRKPQANDVVNMTARLLLGALDVEKLKAEVVAAQALHPFTRKDVKGWTSIPLRSACGMTGAQGCGALGIHASTEAAVFKDTVVMQPYIKVIVDQVAAATASVVLKVRLMKLEAGAKIPMHIDKFNDRNSLARVVRYHIPVVSNPEVHMIVNNRIYYMEPGQLYTIDVSQAHAVENHSTEDRIHLVFDCAK